MEEEVSRLSSALESLSARIAESEAQTAEALSVANAALEAARKSAGENDNSDIMDNFTALSDKVTSFGEQFNRVVEILETQGWNVRKKIGPKVDPEPELEDIE